MNILCLSDLHIYSTTCRIITKLRILYNKYQRDIDCIVISGDVFESDFKNKCKNEYAFLRTIFNDLRVPIVICLGNHELFHSTPQNIRNHYKNINKPEYNIHCLDVCNKYKIGNVLFVGNFLGYDGSLCNIKDQIIEEFADNTWNDYLIQDWNKNWRKECLRNKRIIKRELNKNSANTKILVTHCVPHIDLNLYSQYKNPYNAFSGCKSFLNKINVDYAICGHTHWKTVGKNINNTICINVGSDYNDLKYCIFETKETKWIRRIRF